MTPAQLKKVDWRRVSREKLEAIAAILADKSAPVARIAQDGSPAEVCVVCGCLLEPRPQPHCEGCPDPEDVPEEELHIAFPPR